MNRTCFLSGSGRRGMPPLEYPFSPMKQMIGQCFVNLGRDFGQHPAVQSVAQQARKMRTGYLFQPFASPFQAIPV